MTEIKLLEDFEKDFQEVIFHAQQLYYATIAKKTSVECNC